MKIMKNTTAQGTVIIEVKKVEPSKYKPGWMAVEGVVLEGSITMRVWQSSRPRMQTVNLAGQAYGFNCRPEDLEAIEEVA
jgi:hypothetical protein